MIVIVRILVEILLFKGRAKMKKIISAVVALSISGSVLSAPLNASSLRLKVYKMAVSTSPACTELTTVIDNGNSPSYIDFKANPNLGSGNLADGIYPCVVIEFSDNIKVTPATTGVRCNSTVETTQDVCRDYDGSGPSTPPTSTLIDGSITTCDENDNRVAMYLTTAAANASETDAFNPPGCDTLACDSDTGITLLSSLSVSGTAVGKFTVDTDGKVCDGNDGGSGVCAGETSTTCNMLPPNFSFSQN
jgi:hypothetical protein